MLSEKSGDRYLDRHLEEWQRHIESNRERIAKRRRRNRFFHREIDRLVAANVLPGSRVVDVGCADGETLAACVASYAVGVDIDNEALGEARRRLPEAELIQAPVEVWVPAPDLAPDYIIASLLLDQVYDVHTVLEKLRNISIDSTRLVIVTYNRLWMPAIRLAEALGVKTKSPGENYVPWREVENIIEQADFEVVRRVDGVAIPFHVPVVAPFVNRWVAPLPLVRALSMVRVTVARPRTPPSDIGAVSVVVAARNESGHIRELVDRVPRLAERQELIFVEGNSTDDTWAEICRVAEEARDHPHFVIKTLQQPGKGKGDAVRAGFAAASGDVLMILDADLSVPPEELPRFVQVLADGCCEFANGSRLVYPMDKKAMRFLNLLGNRFFGALFTYLLGQPVRDTLCGTKVLRRDAYQTIAKNREYFGDFDPFGDFDLLFGASRMNLRIRDIPVHYKERTYGETNISRFSHGWLLLRMSGVAAKRLKFVG